jgi:hypothetical protein
MHRATANLPPEVKVAMDQVRSDLAINNHKLSESALLVYAVSRLCVELGRLDPEHQADSFQELFKEAGI